MGEVLQYPAGAREALIGIFGEKLGEFTPHQVATYSDWLMIELWTKGFVIVPYVLTPQKLDS